MRGVRMLVLRITVFLIFMNGLTFHLICGLAKQLGDDAIVKYNMEFKDIGHDQYQSATQIERDDAEKYGAGPAAAGAGQYETKHDWREAMKSYFRDTKSTRHKTGKTGRKISKHQMETAQKNLKASKSRVGDGEVLLFNPGDPAPPFSVFTLDGLLKYPSENLSKCNILIHVYDPVSAMAEALWYSNTTLSMPLTKLPNNTHIIFLSAVENELGTQAAKFLKNRIFNGLNGRLEKDKVKDLASRLHFGINPVNFLGNWIPTVLKEWRCVDHNCGYNQVVVQSPDLFGGVVLRRLDAHYDWLVGPENVFSNKTLPMANGGDGCLPLSAVNQSIAYVKDGGCSYFTKVAAMEKSGALGVIVYAAIPGYIHDMNCQGQECDIPLGIPASMIPSVPDFTGIKDVTVSYQNTPSDNFHFGIDVEGKLAESGWWLYPSTEFLVWQAQWLNYKADLDAKLSKEAMVISVFQNSTMQGNTGVVANITLPSIEKLSMYSLFELDMSLSCPGTKDTTCAHWDRTLQLYVCCSGAPKELCNMEFGRWISPFRRRIGRWLTDVSPLLPLVAGKECTFNMKTDPWAMPWVPSLNLRFSNPQSQGIYPAAIMPLYNPGATFDKNYNSHFKPIQFTVPADIQKVRLYAVITGHGSDENGCGEFCVTSHHFVVNSNFTFNRTFDTAGSPEGCADKVPMGVVPNEHGTWLYGRDGWCDGQEVEAWVIDITDHTVKDKTNMLHYYGWFNGTDPNPKQNPGLITVWSYLVYYKSLS